MNLACFQKPSRYIGNEVNIIHKDADVKIALCFPDTYEIGMSHLGLKILYSIINNISYASAERVFAPWVDFESFLRQKRLPLTSLENKRALKDFDIVGFTLQYELSYTNILNMLDLGEIPIRANDRGDNAPLIIAGGPCAVNPLPLTPFIDAFVIGDGEEIIGEIIEVYKIFKMQNAKCKMFASANPPGTGQNKEFNIKKNLLKELSKLEGIYVPSVHSANKQKVKRRIVENLDKAPFPNAPVVPYASIVHDRSAIEISRGCTKGCRFCQAGMIYRPLRERSLENVLSLSQKSILNTGYEEISFTSLSTGDYNNLLPLIKTFNKICSNPHTAVSLPSLRVGALSNELLKEIKSVRKTGFTIAPEAGTKRLRNIINKDFTEEEYEETLKTIFAEGWRNIKLYFMFGLPTETQADIDGIVTMAEIASKKGRKITGKRVNINVGISAFVPKPHTPFQWLGQTFWEELRVKQDFLKKAFKKRGINFKGQHVELSLLEAVFSRGDKGSAELLETAWSLGCRFDGWSEMFDFDKWLLASEKTGINLYNYASRTFNLNEELPWEFIDTGITDKFMKSEYQKAFQGEITPDCRDICCGCGLECKERAQSTEHRAQNTEHRAQNPQPALPIKLRVRFSKTGMLRYLSHQELMTTILRAIRRAEILVNHSAGFHPHPKVSFGPALPTGIEGLNEYFDIELSNMMKPSDFVKKLNTELPDRITVLDATTISKTEKSLNDFISRYEYEVVIDKAADKSINSFMNLSQCMTSRNKKTVDIRSIVEKAEIKNKILHLTLIDRNGIKVRLYNVLKEMLQKSTEKLHATLIKRIGIYGYNSNEWIDPMGKTNEQ